MQRLTTLAFLTALMGCAPRSNASETTGTTDAAASAASAPMTEVPDGHETALVAGGCFWCIEADLEKVDGVHEVISGYAGGERANPTYQQVSSHQTQHLEVVQVIYNPKKIPTSDVLAWFWELHDPTSKDQQGADKGPQYRSAVFYHSEEQKNLTEASMKEAQKLFKKPIVTVIRKAEKFWVAEDYHQDFYFLNKRRNGYCRFVIQPKLLKLKLKD